MTGYINLLIRLVYSRSIDPQIPRTKFRHVTFGYYSLSYGLIGSIMACASSTNSLSSALSSCDTWLIRSVTANPFIFNILTPYLRAVYIILNFNKFYQETALKTQRLLIKPS